MAKKSVLIVIENKLSIGGVQDVVMSIVRYLHNDFDFDIVVTLPGEAFYNEEFSQYGNIICIDGKKYSNRFAKIINHWIRKKKIIELFQQKKYDTIYCCNMFMAKDYLKFGQKYGVNNRIAHSQIGPPESIKAHSMILHWLWRKTINNFATVKLCVTEKAGKYLFGTMDGVHVIKNPILNFRYFEEIKRDREIDNHIRLLHLGTAIERKNGMFSIDVLYSLLRFNKQYRLTIAGGGEQNYIKLMKEHIQKLELGKYVELIPEFIDVKNALERHDYIIMPSLNEGLPCVLLQAQYLGYTCFVSDIVERISDQGLCKFIPLDVGADTWAEIINQHFLSYGTKRIFIDMSGWDGKTVSEEYKRLFNLEFAI